MVHWQALRYFVKEALASLYRSRRVSSIATGTIAVAMFIFGIFLLVSENLARVVETWGDEIHVSVFLREDITPEEYAQLAYFARNEPLVASAAYVSKQEAVRRFQKFYKTLRPLTSEWTDTPLPASLEIEIRPGRFERARLEELVAGLGGLRGVDEIQYDLEWIDRLKKVISLIRLGGLLVGLLLAAGAIFTISNVVRLTVYMYRDEIEIMRLVGATESYIRGPFVVEGLLQGLFGGVGAVSLLALLYHGLVIYLTRETNLFFNFLILSFLPPSSIALLIAGACTAGLVGSLFSMRRDLFRQ